MLFSSANQGIIFLTILYCGFLISLFDEIPNYINSKITNKLLQQIIDCLRAIIFCILFFVLLCYIYYGELRLFCIIAYIIGIVIEKLLCSKTIIKALSIITSKIPKIKKIVKQHKKKKHLLFIKIKNKPNKNIRKKILYKKEKES